MQIARKLFAVEYVDPKDGTRRFKPASSYDLRRFKKRKLNCKTKVLTCQSPIHESPQEAEMIGGR